LLLTQLAMCFFGGLNLLLESPFLGSIFWVILGAGIRMIGLLRSPAVPVVVTSCAT
jgi:hypothetical protein